MAACQPTLVVPLGFEPLVAPLPSPTVPSGFLPCAASTTTTWSHVAQSSPIVPSATKPTLVMPHTALEYLAAPRVAAAPPATMDGPPPRE
jgi:hypothetical protein